ncbi:FAD-dependent oxidoreductase [bacterium]|nr:FAD-dependent oxidoreductase [bacterium]
MSDAPATAWRCLVCGNIHRGPEPPEWCPVCGAGPEDFEPHAEEAKPAAPATRQWRCLNCNYVHAGPEPPAECPVCGAPADRFEPVAVESREAATAGRDTHVVVLGAGIAGISAVESLRQAAPEAEITLVSKEVDLPYYRLNLTRLLAGEIDETALPIHPTSWYEENRVRLVLGDEARSLQLDDLAVDLRSGKTLSFERIILTVGAHPFVPPFPGAQREGVSSLRTIADARRILASPLDGMRCVCIGGGLLGLEAAGALARRGADVTLLEGHEWLMPRQLNRRAGEILGSHIGGIGIHLRTQARTDSIVGDERVAGVQLTDGATVPADLVLIATGVRPNSHLARRTGLDVNKGVVVDNHLSGSHPCVLAAGDVAEHRGALYGSWAAAQYQGSIAGLNAAGVGTEFGGLPRSNTLKVLGLDLLSIGQFEPEDGSYDVLEQEEGGTYFRFVFHDGRMAGAILLGDTSLSSPLKKAIEGGEDFSGLLRKSPSAAAVMDRLS